MDEIFIIVEETVHAVLSRYVGGFMTDERLSHDRIGKADTLEGYGNDIDIVTFHTTLQEAENALSRLQETEVRGLLPEVTGRYPRPAREILLERKQYFVMRLQKGQNFAYVYEQHGWRSWRIGKEILPHAPREL